jgi:hypothetical protein
MFFNVRHTLIILLHIYIFLYIYKYNNPLHSNEFEYDSQHNYPEGEDMYSFSSGKTGYAIPGKQVKDYVNHLDDEEFGSIEEQGGNVDDMNADDVQPAYNFDSNGPGDVYPVNEFEDDVKEILGDIRVDISAHIRQFSKGGNND